MSQAIVKTSRELQELAKRRDSVIVAFSGGKDALCCLDLCSRAFKRVVCFYRYFVPGLAFIEKQLADARERWGVPILQYPSASFVRALSEGYFRLPFSGLPEIDTHDISRQVMRDTGIDLIVTGEKKADGIWRKRQMANNRYARQHLYCPLADWKKWDVISYLRGRGIPLPESSDGHQSAGVDASQQFIVWLYKNHPDDFERYCEWFPWAMAAVKRREWYGEEIGLK